MLVHATSKSEADLIDLFKSQQFGNHQTSLAAMKHIHTSKTSSISTVRNRRVHTNQKLKYIKAVNVRLDALWLRSAEAAITIVVLSALDQWFCAEPQVETAIIPAESHPKTNSRVSRQDIGATKQLARTIQKFCICWYRVKHVKKYTDLS